jgi:hypothetical protein
MMFLEKLVGPKRHPLRLGVAVKIIFAQVRPIVRRAIFACDHHDVAAKPFLAQRLRGGETGCARTDDHELSRIGGRIGFDHDWRASVRRIVRYADHDAFAVDAHVVTGECIECRRLFEISVHDVERRVVPGANDACAAQDAFRERCAVVGASRADGVETIVNACQQDSRLAGGNFFHFTVPQVGGIRYMNFYRTHCRYEATLTRWPIFSFLIFR